MKVIFLDFDGVLNNSKFFSDQKNHYDGEYSVLDERNEFDLVNVANLAIVLTAVPDAKVVVSSSWRIGRDLTTLKYLLGALGSLVDRLIDVTPDLSRSTYDRGYEIADWLSRHPEVSSFVILDDDSDMVHLIPRHIKTNWNVGFTLEQASLAIKMLKESK